jgi:hypothetical protein
MQEKNGNLLKDLNVIEACIGRLRYGNKKFFVKIIPVFLLTSRTVKIRSVLLSAVISYTTCFVGTAVLT